MNVGRRIAKIRFSLSAALILFGLLGSWGGSRVTEPCQTVGQYHIEALLLPDSVALGDSLEVAMVWFRDCKTDITRVDSTIMGHQITLAVFGTFWTGSCPRPYCPARLDTLTLLFALRARDIVTVAILQPSGATLADSVTVY